jgi:tryptophanyl-tRNA synthetase
MKPRIFSGMQPTGNLHIGNYLGALKTWARLQYEYEPIFCIVDQHAITVYQDPKTLQEQIEDVAALYVASGIDPKHCAVFVQSSVPAHVELAWVFMCVTPMGWLSRMTQFKAKSGKQESVGTGLFAYPALMAADILLYQAAIVPVGEDQAQHLELTRDIAQRFNSLYGETFVVPETHLPVVGSRIMGLDDPEQKMSKSAPGTGHAVGLLDPPNRIRKLIARAKTDSKPGIDMDDPGAGGANLLNIFQAFSERDDEQMQSHFAGMRYGDLKKEVGEMVASHLEPIQQKYAELTDDREVIRKILREGAERVAPIAESTMKTVRERTGLYRV